jgi:hypothetical protein
MSSITQIFDWAKSLNINGFNIYQMATKNIIRIHEVDHSKCSYAINVGDAVIQIDGIPIDNWSYKDLTQYLCSNVITSIEAIGYFHYKKRKLNNDNEHNINPPIIKTTSQYRGPRGPYKKKMKPVYSTTKPDLISVDSTDNICNDSGAVLFPLNVN